MKADRKPTSIMTVQQVASYLQVNKLTIYRYIREGMLPAVRLGRSFRVLREDVDRFLEAHRVPAARPIQAVPKAAPLQRPAVPRPQTLPETSPKKQVDQVYVGPTREERVQSRETLVTSNPIDWVIRGLH